MGLSMPDLSLEQHWLCSGCTLLGNSRWERGARNGRQQPCNHHGQCREQKVFQVWSRSSLQPRRLPWWSKLSSCVEPIGTTQSRTSCAATEEPTVQPCLWLKEASDPKKPLQEQTLRWSCRPWRGAHSGAGALGDLPPWGCAGAVPEGWALWDGVVLEQCWEICGLWKAHVGSVWE